MYLGIEIGGTKLQRRLGVGDGTLIGLWRGGVDVAAGAPGIRQRIEEAVPELLAQAGVEREALRRRHWLRRPGGGCDPIGNQVPSN